MEMQMEKRQIKHIRVKHFIKIALSVGALAVGFEEVAENMLPDFEGILELHHAVIMIGLSHFVEAYDTLRERLEEARELASSKESP